MFVRQHGHGHAGGLAGIGGLIGFIAAVTALSSLRSAHDFTQGCVGTLPWGYLSQTSVEQPLDRFPFPSRQSGGQKG
jgi:hypothetical protein